MNEKFFIVHTPPEFSNNISFYGKPDAPICGAFVVSLKDARSYDTYGQAQQALSNMHKTPESFYSINKYFVANS